jgi:hypothetical protein
MNANPSANPHMTDATALRVAGKRTFAGYPIALPNHFLNERQVEPIQESLGPAQFPSLCEKDLIPTLAKNQQWLLSPS